HTSFSRDWGSDVCSSDLPEALGNTFAARLLKDYNAQTYWLSVDADKFFTFPKWLNVAVGYGVADMPYALDVINEKMGYDPYRQYYVSLRSEEHTSELQSRENLVCRLL